MAKTRRERCPHCGFLEVIKWGKQCGHQRYKCKKCGSLFTFRRKDISKANCFVWFEWWILRKQWISDFKNWSEKYKDYLNEKTFIEESHREWYTHKMVRRACVHIKKALPDMFHFLDNPRVSKTTNALESFFGHLKENVTLHRGMSYRHYQNYVKWYLYFRNTDNKKRGK